MRKSFWSALLVGLLLGSVLSTPTLAQTPLSAQIQRAIRGLLAGANTWTGLQTFSGGISATGVETTTVNAIGIVSTDGTVCQNTTAATASVTVQMSPRCPRIAGTAWDTAASQTVAFFQEVLPATAATPTGTWKLGYSLNGGAATYPLTVSSAGVLTTLSSLTVGNTLTFAGNFRGAGGNVIGSAVTLPTATGSFGTSSAATAATSTMAFTINVGTGGTASTGTITFLAAPTGWVVDCHDVTTPGSFVTEQTGGSATTATVQNYSRTTGLPIAWTASDILRCTAFGY